MIATDYYFVSTLLPTLKVGLAPALPLVDLKNLLVDNLTPSDYAKTRVIRFTIDLDNLSSLWRGEPLDPRGNYSQPQLEEVLTMRTGLPHCIFEYIDRHDTPAERLKYFPELIALFFAELIPLYSGFLKDYLQFERDWRLVMTGFRAKRIGRDLTQEIQFEDPSDDLVAQLMAQRDAKVYEPPVDYQDLKEIFDHNSDRPLEMYRQLAEYRLNKFEDFIDGDRFSIDRILSYLAQLLIVERWEELNQESGMSRALARLQP